MHWKIKKLLLDFFAGRISQDNFYKGLQGKFNNLEIKSRHQSRQRPLNYKL